VRAHKRQNLCRVTYLRACLPFHAVQLRERREALEADQQAARIALPVQRSRCAGQELQLRRRELLPKRLVRTGKFSERAGGGFKPQAGLESCMLHSL
jgi:hypothetical protein